MSSEKWYWQEPFLFEGTARVLRGGVFQDQPTLTLDRSLFYPEGGGQLGDRGRISFGEIIRTVKDTQITDDGAIFVILDQPFSEDVGGRTVQMRVDEAWRRRQMSQHTGQHLLSRLLQEKYQAPTISARLGEHLFSVDVASSLFTNEQIQAMEDELNRLILEDRPIRAWFPTPEELAALPLRKQPSVDTQIRIIQVEGFDVTPCGGTHCTSTGQVGIVHIQSVEKYKQLIRITASAGLDAVRDFHAKEVILQQSYTLLSATSETLIPAIEALQTRQADLEVRLKERTSQLAQQQAASILPITTESGVVTKELPEEDIEYARTLVKELAKQHGVTAMVSCPTKEGIFVVLDRFEKSPIDIGAVLKEVLLSHGGKGGGSPMHAEGRGPDSTFLVALTQKLL